MVLRNQQAGAPNFVKLFYEKAAFCEEIPRTKGGCIRSFRQKTGKEGVQITLNPSQTALTSILKTCKIGAWKTPERLDATRFSPHGI